MTNDTIKELELIYFYNFNNFFFFFHIISENSLVSLVESAGPSRFAFIVRVHISIMGQKETEIA